MKMRLAILLFVSSCVVGCSPVKGYLGPELPEDRVSTISTSYDSDYMEVEDSTVDGIGFYSTGINVLPGTHSFHFNVTTKEPPFDCETTSSMDYEGYDDCRDERGSGECDCYDYLTIYKRCFREVHDGSCEGSLRTVAGGKYQIAISPDGEGATLKILGPGTGSAGTGRCATSGRRIEREETNQGTGSYVAHDNGIWSCR